MPGIPTKGIANGLSLIASHRSIAVSAVLAKKQSGKKRDTVTKEADEEPIDVKQYVGQARERFAKTLELYKKKLQVQSQGNANPKVFDRIILQDGRGFLEVAATSLKGKNALLVTVYDPKDTKHIISAIMAADLNLNPERVPNNEQQLKIALPPPTTESRNKLRQALKGTFEHFKNSVSKDSLGYTRGEILKQLKKFDKNNDAVRKVMQDLEKVHKEYVSKLEEQLKLAEKRLG